MLKCKHHKHCPYYQTESATCQSRRKAKESYCGHYRELEIKKTFIPKKLKIERDKPIPFDGAWLLTTMAGMMKKGTWKRESQPKKESWLNKHFSKVKRMFLILIP